MKNLLLIAYFFPPQNNGGVQRPLKMQKFLPKFGINVTVLTHTYDRTDIRANSDVIRVFDTNMNGLNKLIHIPIRIIQNIRLKIGFHLNWFEMWNAEVKARSDDIIAASRPDFILATYPPIEALDLGLYFSKKYKIPLVADFRDGLLFEPLDLGMLNSKRRLKYYVSIEKEIARLSAGIVTVSEPISDYFKKTYKNDRILTIPNGFDPEDFAFVASEVQLDPTKYNIVYTGSLGGSEPGRDVSSFVQAVELLLKTFPATIEKLRIHFIGHMYPKEQRSLSSLFKCGIVQFHGKVDRRLALAFQKEADLLLLITSTRQKSMVTGKLFEYLCAGRPILGLTHDTPAEKIINQTQTGWTVDPADVDGIYALLRQIILVPNFMDTIKRQSSEIYKYSRESQMKELALFLGKL